METATYTPVPKPRKAERKYVSLAEWQRLLEQARQAGLYEHVLIRLVYELALRAAEPGKLRLDHCSLLHEHRIYIPRGKNSVNKWTPISHELVLLLNAWICETYPDITLRKDHHFLFPGRRIEGVRQGVSRYFVYNLVKDLSVRAGIPTEVTHPHALRHGRIQHLFEEADRQGLQLEVVLQTAAGLVGHKNAWTTLQHYVASTGVGRRLAEQVLSKAMAQAGEVL